MSKTSQELLKNILLEPFPEERNNLISVWALKLEKYCLSTVLFQKCGEKAFDRIRHIYDYQYALRATSGSE